MSVHNYHDGNADSLVSRLILAATVELAPHGDKTGKFDRLSAETDSFQRVELKLTMNGHEVSIVDFLDRFEDGFDRAVHDEARRLVDQLVDLDSIEEVVSQAQRELRKKLRDVLGVELHEDDVY